MFPGIRRRARRCRRQGLPRVRGRAGRGPLPGRHVAPAAAHLRGDVRPAPPRIKLASGWLPNADLLTHSEMSILRSEVADVHNEMVLGENAYVVPMASLLLFKIAASEG